MEPAAGLDKELATQSLSEAKATAYNVRSAIAEIAAREKADFEREKRQKNLPALQRAKYAALL